MKRFLAGVDRTPIEVLVDDLINAILTKNERQTSKLIYVLHVVIEEVDGDDDGFEDMIDQMVEDWTRIANDSKRFWHKVKKL